MIGGVPLWVFLVIVLIFFSGFMAFQAIQKERKQDAQFIEKEGQVNMERIETEKALRKRAEN